MARRWVVLTADRATGRGAGSANEIIEYTEWDGRIRGADEVIYTDPVDSGGDPVDAKWHVGGSVTLSGTTYTYTEPPGQLVPDDLSTDTGMLRAATRAAHEQLLVWSQELTFEGEGHPAEFVSLGHDYIARGHQGIFLCVHNHRTGTNPDWTVAQRIAVCQGMAQGAADITSPFTFYMSLAGGGTPISKPTAPVLWVNPNTGARVDLNMAITNTSGEALLDVSQLPSASIIHGNWINELTA